MLTTQDLYTGYDAGNVLQGVSVSVRQGEIVALVGRNGVGKSTFIKAVIGELAIRSGSIIFRGKDITHFKAHHRAHLGIGYVPQGRDVFPQMTVQENLYMGQFINKEKLEPRYDLAYGYFPFLKERLSQKAGTLSGGEQQMLAIGRALVGAPHLLLLDEPSEGVQPSIVQEIGESINMLNSREGLTVLLVEQNLDLMQKVVQRAYVIDKGRVVPNLIVIKSKIPSSL